MCISQRFLFTYLYFQNISTPTPRPIIVMHSVPDLSVWIRFPSPTPLSCRGREGVQRAQPHTQSWAACIGEQVFKGMGLKTMVMTFAVSCKLLSGHLEDSGAF